MLKKIGLVLMAMVMLTTLSFAGSKQVTFSWQQAAADLPNLASWNIKYSMTSGGPYTQLANIPYVSPQTTYTSNQTINLVADGAKATVYFVATAVGKSGAESAVSNQASGVFDFTTVGVPIQFTITIS